MHIGCICEMYSLETYKVPVLYQYQYPTSSTHYDKIDFHCNIQMQVALANT